MTSWSMAAARNVSPAASRPGRPPPRGTWLVRAAARAETIDDNRRGRNADVALHQRRFQVFEELGPRRLAEDLLDAGREGLARAGGTRLQAMPKAHLHQDTHTIKH